MRFLRPLLAATSLLAATPDCATASRPHNTQDETAQFAHFLVDGLASLPSPAGCRVVMEVVEERLRAFGAKRTAAGKCLGCPIYFDLGGGRTQVVFSMERTHDETRRAIFRVLIQRKSTKEDPPGVFNGEITKLCIE